MHRLLRASILIMFGMLIIGIISGCGDDLSEEVTDPSDPTASGTTPPRKPIQPFDDPFPPILPFVVDPAPGGKIPPNTQFSLTFDQAVVAVTVNGVPATGAGDSWTVSLILPEGDGQTLNVLWTNRDGSFGSRVDGPYTVRIPDTTPPRITGWTVANGAVDVDPAPINAGDFRFVFDEPVTGAITLTNEAGANLNWIGIVAGKTATLTAVAGQELVNEATYRIEIDVQDSDGNPLQTTITFITKPK